MRRSATKRRRSGTVSSIALSASRKPTITLIAANSVVDWSLGATACASRRSSSSAASTLTCSPPSVRSSLATTRSVPGCGSISACVTRPRSPVSSWARASGVTATGLAANTPNSELFSTAATVIVRAMPNASTVTCSPGSAPTASATLSGRINPPVK